MAESPGNTCWCLQRNGRREGLTHGAGRCVGLHQVCNGLPSDQPQPTVHTNLLSAACGSQSFIVASALDAVDLVRRTQAQLVEQSLLILGKQLGEGCMVMTHLQTAVVQGPGPQSALKDGSVYRNVDALVNPHALFDVPWTLNLGGVRSERIRKDSPNYNLVKVWPAWRLPSRLRRLRRIAEWAHDAHTSLLHGESSQGPCRWHPGGADHALAEWPRNVMASFTESLPKRVPHKRPVQTTRQCSPAPGAHKTKSWPPG